MLHVVVVTYCRASLILFNYAYVQQHDIYDRIHSITINIKRATYHTTITITTRRKKIHHLLYIFEKVMATWCYCWEEEEEKKNNKELDGWRKKERKTGVKQKNIKRALNFRKKSRSVIFCSCSCSCCCLLFVIWCCCCCCGCCCVNRLERPIVAIVLFGFALFYMRNIKKTI